MNEGNPRFRRHRLYTLDCLKPPHRVHRRTPESARCPGLPIYVPAGRLGAHRQRNHEGSAPHPVGSPSAPLPSVGAFPDSGRAARRHAAPHVDRQRPHPMAGLVDAPGGRPVPHPGFARLGHAHHAGPHRTHSDQCRRRTADRFLPGALRGSRLARLAASTYERSHRRPPRSGGCLPHLGALAHTLPAVGNPAHRWGLAASGSP